MGIVTADMSMSLDGFIAGPQDDAKPDREVAALDRLHDWMFPPKGKFEDVERAFPGIATLSCKGTELLLRWIKALLGRAVVASMEGVKAAQITFSNDPTSKPTESAY